MAKDSSFEKDTISYIGEIKPEAQKTYGVEFKRQQIIRFIRKNPDCTIYGISKGVDLAYASTHQALKELVFARVVCTKQGFDSNGTPQEVFFIPKPKGGDDGNQ